MPKIKIAVNATGIDAVEIDGQPTRVTALDVRMRGRSTHVALELVGEQQQPQPRLLTRVLGPLARGKRK